MFLNCEYLKGRGEINEEEENKKKKKKKKKKSFNKPEHDTKSSCFS